MSNPFSRFVNNDSSNLPPGLDSANLGQTSGPGAVDIDSESLVIGSLLKNNGWIVDCPLQKEHFASGIWSAAFASIKAIQAADGGKLFVDAHRLAEHSAMDAKYLQGAQSAANVEAFCGHVNAVKNAYGLRRTREICGLASEAATNVHADVKEILGQLGTQIQDIFATAAEEVEFDEPLSMKNIVATANEIDALANGKEPEGEPLQCIKIGLDAIDRVGGLLVGGVHVLAGSPGSGKTALADAMCRFVAVNGGGALLWSQELQSDFIVRRSIAAQAGIPQDVLTRRSFEHATPTEALQKVIELETLATNKYAVLSKTRRITDLRGDVLSYIRKYGSAPSLIALDYLQITDLTSAGREEQRYRALGKLGQELCKIAKDFKTCVIALSQITTKEGQEPTMFDLRESQDIGMSGTSVILLYKLPDATQNAHRANRGHGDLIKLKVEKIRSAAPFVDYITFDGRYLRFDSMPLGYEPPMPPSASTPKISSRY